MENDYKEIDNLFLENYLDVNYKNFYNLEKDENEENEIDLLWKTDIYKNINILNKGYENKKPKININDIKSNKTIIKTNEVNENVKNKTNKISNNFKLIKSIYHNKRNSINKKTDDKNNNIDLKNIFNFLKNFKNLDWLLSKITNEKKNNLFLNEIKMLNQKDTNINYNNQNIKENNNILLLIENIKKFILKLKEDKEILRIKNNNLLLINKKNFIAFRDNYIKYEFQEEAEEIKKKKRTSLRNNSDSYKCFKDIIKLKYKYNLENEEKKFNLDINNLEKVNAKKIKLIDNIINNKIKKIIEYYKNFIFKEKNISLLKNGIAYFLCELINYEKDFDFQVLDKYFNELESKILYLKIKIHIILNKKKNDLKDLNLSYNSIEKVKINNNNPKQKTKLNKSFEIKSVKFYKNTFIKKNLNNNKILTKNKIINKYQNKYKKFILELKDSDLDINIYDLINLENKIDESFYHFLLKEYDLKLDKLKLNNKKNEFKKFIELKYDFFYKLIKIFGIRKTKYLIRLNHSNFLIDYNIYIKNQINNN